MSGKPASFTPWNILSGNDIPAFKETRSWGGHLMQRRSDVTKVTWTKGQGAHTLPPGGKRQFWGRAAFGVLRRKPQDACFWGSPDSQNARDGLPPLVADIHVDADPIARTRGRHELVLQELLAGACSQGRFRRQQDVLYRSVFFQPQYD